jgi:hypothetical protein
MSDFELRRFGQRARKLSEPRMNFGETEPHVMELEEGRDGAGDIPSTHTTAHSRRLPDL